MLPVLPFLIFCFLLNRSQAAYLVAGISGFVVDFISATPSGFITARWLLVALIIDFVQNYVITNKSLYGSWLMAVIARIADGILTIMIYIVFNFIWGGLFIIEPVIFQIPILFVDLIVISILFLSVSLLTKRFLTFIPFEKNRYGS